MKPPEAWGHEPFKLGEGNQLVAHIVWWTVITDDNDENPVYCLRVADHGEDIDDPQVLRILIDPDIAEAMAQQFLTEAMPYLAELEEKQGGRRH
jgi:hypothetical protein